MPTVHTSYWHWKIFCSYGYVKWCKNIQKLTFSTQQVTASSAVHHPNQYFDESHQSLQDGQGGASRLGSAAHSGLEHGKVTVKNEISSITNVPKTDTDNDLCDIQMDDDDDDDILGEIEKMDTMA